MRKSIVVAVAVLGILCVGSTWSAKSQSTPATTADVKRLMSAMHFNTDEMVRAISDSFKTHMKMTLKSDKFDKKFSEAMEVLLNEIDFGELQNLSSPLYQKYYTHEELVMLIDFYESPIGRKMLEVEVKIAAESVPMTSKWIQEKSAAVMEKFKAKTKKSQ